MISEKRVWKECGTHAPKVTDIINTYSKSNRILIVFWHGIGDVLMFRPVYEGLKLRYPNHHFDFGLLPGVGHKELIEDGLELTEDEFTKDHDVAFVISFPMIEGNIRDKKTKAEYCIEKEIGDIGSVNLELPNIPSTFNRLVGVHFQGTCLPGSTNPDEVLAKRIWDDLIAADYVPIDLHFKHVFHNPVNKEFSWITRSCRELEPSLKTLQMIIDQCFAVVAVASGPLVISLCRKPYHTVYLQKHHDIGCYTRNVSFVVDLKNYDKNVLLGYLNTMKGIANV